MTQASEDAPRGLPRWMLFTILALVVTLFMITRGAVWRDPWNPAALDSAIFWSYLPIPFLVAGGLLLARRFAWRFVFLDSLTITLVKYAITFCIALVFWSLKDPPPPAVNVKSPPVLKSAVPEAPPPPPTVIDPERTGTLQGVLKNPAGQPVEGAVVYVASGLEAFVFARPTDPVRVENNGTTVTPLLVVARAGQPILGRSLDGHLHTLVSSGDGATGTTFNIPMMSSGAWSTVIVREPAKISRLRCTVHPTGETPAHLLVLDHPFVTTTAPDGSFRLPAIPVAKLTLAAWHPTLTALSPPTDLLAKTDTTVELTPTLTDTH